MSYSKLPSDGVLRCPACSLPTEENSCSKSTCCEARLWGIDYSDFVEKWERFNKDNIE